MSSIWHSDPDEVGTSSVFDPLCIERSAPVDDEEAALVEALCQAATPGPLVIDDEVEGEGAIVVSLPDGRMIVSLTAAVEQTRDEVATRANAQLICKARFLLLRLLRDRQQWKEQREFLLERIRTLEAALGIEGDAAAQSDGSRTSRAAPHPR
ncbi:MAG: hypothetical protein ACYSWU_13455 [Planctomycetota bacterium]|jgi:hypothetical protein